MDIVDVRVLAEHALNVAACCRACHVFHTRRYYVQAASVGSPAARVRDQVRSSKEEVFAPRGWRFLRVIEIREDLAVPEHLTKRLEKGYRQAHSALKRMEWESAGANFGRLIDLATKHLKPDFKGDLFNRIDALAAEGQIPVGLKDLAHRLRVMRNEALHEDADVSEDHAKAAAEFTELFLTYTFTLPTKLQAQTDQPAEGAEIIEATDTP